VVKTSSSTLAGVRGSRIYTQSWLPDGPPRAALLLVHGLGEHCGRYQNVVDHLVPLGYAVYGIDHLGHGQSEGQREYVDRFTDFTHTLKIYFDQVRALHSAPFPIFILGHSLGGLISTVYLLDHQAELSGAILFAPAVKAPASGSRLTILILAGRLLSTLVPRAGVRGFDAPAISRDPAVVTAYNNDPLVFRGKLTARLGSEMLGAIQRVRAEAPTIKLPLLILQGSADKLVDPTGAQDLCDAVQSADKTLKVYPGLYHEVFNEPEHPQVLADVANWLATHP
jgi:acylglycerol lipase